ncbi:MAG: metal ABC transporter substrate-binding protein [Caulobacteraceae bacterium]
MKRFFTVVVIICLSLVLWGCSSEGYSGKPKIYASFYPMYFLTQQIAGDKAEVICMIPAGVEPHDWEPTPKLVGEMQEASMFVYNGVGMETWANNIIKNIDRDKTKIVEASSGVELLKAEGQQNIYDPHVWVSPLRAMQQAKTIYEAIIQTDPANAEYYRSNYESLKQRLSKLDKDIREASKSFRSNIIVVSHEAFGYFAQDYGLKQIAIRGVNPEAEPSPTQMAELVNICKENKVRYVFFEKLTNPKLSETLAREVDAGTMILNDAAGLSEEDEKAGMDYVSIMYQNVENLKKALSE